MKFKIWLLERGGLGGAAGMVDPDISNASMPMIRSKLSCQDGSTPNKEPHTGANPKKLFGFHAPEDLKRISKRRAKNIDKEKSDNPEERIPPDTVF